MLLDRLSLVRTRPIAPSKGFIGKTTLVMPKGAFSPSLNIASSPFCKGRYRGIYTTNSLGEYHLPIRQSRSSLGQKPKSHRIIHFSARGNAYPISIIVSWKLQIEKKTLVNHRETLRYAQGVMRFTPLFSEAVSAFRIILSSSLLAKERKCIFWFWYLEFGLCLDFGIWNLEFI